MFRVGDQVVITGPNWSGKTDFIGQTGVITDTDNVKNCLEFKVDVPPIGNLAAYFPSSSLSPVVTETLKALKRCLK